MFFISLFIFSSIREFSNEFLSLFLFPWAYSLEIKDGALEAKFIFDFYYVLLVIPAYDWLIFRLILPKYLPDEKTWKEKSCFYQHQEN